MPRFRALLRLTILAMMPANTAWPEDGSMTKDQIACWKLMAKALQEICLFSMLSRKVTAEITIREWPYEDMAYGLEWVIALEEILRPEQGQTVAN
jgi:hypothetical protein